MLPVTVPAPQQEVWRALGENLSAVIAQAKRQAPVADHADTVVYPLLQVCLSFLS